MNVDSVLKTFGIVVICLNLQTNEVFGLNDRNRTAVEINTFGPSQHGLADFPARVLEIDADVATRIAAEFITFDDDLRTAFTHDVAHLRNHALMYEETDIGGAARETPWPERKPANQGKFDRRFIQGCGKIEQQFANG